MSINYLFEKSLRKELRTLRNNCLLIIFLTNLVWRNLENE